MKKDYIKFNIRGNITLTSIANRIGIAPEELKKFHNASCQKQEKIYFDNLRGLKFVLIPTNYKTPEEEVFLLELVRLSNQYSKDFLFKNYSVIETYEKPNEEDLSIRYSIHIDFPEKENSSLLNISQTDFINRNEKPSGKMTELSMLCMESLYPLPILISDSGKMLGIHHHKHLVEKFEKKRNDIEIFFISDASNRYLDLFYENLSDEDFFFNHLKSTLLYQTIFPDMKWFRKNKNWTESFFIHQNSFPVTCSFEVDYYHSDDNIEISIDGEISESISLQEVILGKKNEATPERSVEGKINFRYVISKKDKSLLKAVSTITLLYEKKLFERQHIEITSKNL